VRACAYERCQTKRHIAKEGRQGKKRKHEKIDAKRERERDGASETKREKRGKSKARSRA
jgi:hypothetical protein